MRVIDGALALRHIDEAALLRKIGEERRARREGNDALRRNLPRCIGEEAEGGKFRGRLLREDRRLIYGGGRARHRPYRRTNKKHGEKRQLQERYGSARRHEAQPSASCGSFTGWGSGRLPS